MSGFPTDIMETAGRLVDLAIRNYEKEVFANVSRDHVAAAILAERQRCADVAEGFRQAHDTGSGFDSQPARQTATEIRDAILA